jgi:nitroreductase
MGLGACAIGAFYDEDFNRLLGVDGREESVLYLVAVGKI